MEFKSLALSLIILALPALARAQSGALTGELAIASKYLDRGIERGDLTWHPSLEYGYGDFYAGFWAAMPLENKGAPEFFSEERDLYAGYGWALGDKVALDVGGTRHFLEGASDTFEGYAGLNGEFGTFSPSLYLYYDFDLETLAVELSTGVALPLEGFPVEATFRLGWSESRTVYDYLYFGVDMVYPIKLGDRATLGLGLHYDGNDAGFGVPDSHLYGSAAVTMRF